MEVRFGGKAKYYGAKISRVNGDGTYEVQYNDGDTEMSVAAELICAPSVAGMFANGEKIEGRYNGKNKWYGGSIEKDNKDGTYAIKYDDGESEPRVAFVRRAAAAPSPEASVKVLSVPIKFGAGDTVEARYGGKAKYYGGKIVGANGDGTFEVCYDDGDTEKAVAGALIRRKAAQEATASSAPTPGKPVTSASDATAAVSLGARATMFGEAPTVSGKFAAGDAVEARYGGKARYYDGKIVGANGDGTFEVCYDDGDTEKAVVGALIRRKGAQEAAAPRSFAGAADVFSVTHDDEPSRPAPLDGTPHESTGAMNSKDGPHASRVGGGDATETGAPRGAERGGARASDTSAPAYPAPDCAPDFAPDVASDFAPDVVHPAGSGAPRDEAVLAVKCAEVTTRASALASDKAEAAAAALRPQPLRDAKLAGVLDRLVLLREAPSRWDRVRASVFASFAHEAVARAQEVKELRHRLHRAHTALAGATANATASRAEGTHADAAAAGGRAHWRASAASSASGVGSGMLVRFLRVEVGLCEGAAAAAAAALGVSDLGALAANASEVLRTPSTTHLARCHAP